jgi:hypothetical protein
MGSISMEELLPEVFGNPDDARPISPLRLPPKTRVMRSGFERSQRGELVFEGETEVGVRLVERVWEYKQLPDTSTLRKARCWRLEFGVDARKAAPITDGHVMVVAQEPFGNRWVHRSKFRKYSKKKDRDELTVPENGLTGDMDALEWLELHAEHDPWEKNQRLVAGISRPRGFHSDKQRNAAGDLILGACPDFDEIVNELLASKEIQRLLRVTEKGRIRYWNHRKVGTLPPPLYPEVIDQSHDLMLVSIRQALAGPRRAVDTWIGHPVWKWVSCVYRDHLNECNKVVDRRVKRDQNINTVVQQRIKQATHIAAVKGYS